MSSSDPELTSDSNEPSKPGERSCARYSLRKPPTTAPIYKKSRHPQDKELGIGHRSTYSLGINDRRFRKSHTKKRKIFLESSELEDERPSKSSRRLEAVVIGDSDAVSVEDDDAGPEQTQTIDGFSGSRGLSVTGGRIHPGQDGNAPSFDSTYSSGRPSTESLHQRPVASRASISFDKAASSTSAVPWNGTHPTDQKISGNINQRSHQELQIGGGRLKDSFQIGVCSQENVQSPHQAKHVRLSDALGPLVGDQPGGSQGTEDEQVDGNCPSDPSVLSSSPSKNNDANLPTLRPEDGFYWDSPATSPSKVYETQETQRLPDYQPESRFSRKHQNSQVRSEISCPSSDLRSIAVASLEEGLRKRPKRDSKPDPHDFRIFEDESAGQMENTRRQEVQQFDEVDQENIGLGSDGQADETGLLKSEVCTKKIIQETSLAPSDNDIYSPSVSSGKRSSSNSTRRVRFVSDSEPTDAVVGAHSPSEIDENVCDETSSLLHMVSDADRSLSGADGSEG